MWRTTLYFCVLDLSYVQLYKNFMMNIFIFLRSSKNNIIFFIQGNQLLCDPATKVWGNLCLYCSQVKYYTAYNFWIVIKKVTLFHEAYAWIMFTAWITLIFWAYEISNISVEKIMLLAAYRVVTLNLYQYGVRYNCGSLTKNTSN